MTTKAQKDYSKGKIYKIEPICEYDEGEIYIGSTTKDYLSQRFVKHRSDYNRWKKDNNKFITSYRIFDKYGIGNCQVVLLELVNANDFNELKAREKHYTKTLKCVNKLIPLRNDNEYYNDTKENKHTCECGSVCVSKVKERHFQTKKHQLYLESLQT